MEIGRAFHWACGPASCLGRTILNYWKLQSLKASSMSSIIEPPRMEMLGAPPAELLSLILNQNLLCCQSWPFLLHFHCESLRRVCSSLPNSLWLGISLSVSSSRWVSVLEMHPCGSATWKPSFCQLKMRACPLLVARPEDVKQHQPSALSPLATPKPIFSQVPGVRPQTPAPWALTRPLSSPPAVPWTCPLSPPQFASTASMENREIIVAGSAGV